MMQKQNITTMLEAPKKEIGWDVIIISTSTPGQEEYWQNHLTHLRGSLIKQSSLVITVHEDWPGGAGNGLGTLYAYQKAIEKGKNLFNINLTDVQKKGGTIAIYHTAGKGQRLFPLTGSEYCNKPAVKLPEIITPSEYLTILDGVIRQTVPYAQSRSGRLSVFWADQLFVPSKSFEYTPKHHIDILMQMTSLPSEKEWTSRGLSNFGLIIPGNNDEAQVMDKSDYKDIKKLVGTVKDVGISLGSFSLSYDMTMGLIQLFKKELDEKTIKMDSDPHIWMPLTLSEDVYVALMHKKGVSTDSAKSHYKRIHSFKTEFLKKSPALKLFGALDVGSDSYWWDYGTVNNYYSNMIKLTHKTPESEAMRKFFSLKMDKNNNCVSHSFTKTASLKNSVIIGSAADSFAGENIVVINSILGELKGENSLLYNVMEEHSHAHPSGAIRADLRYKGEKISLNSTLGRDGKTDWNVKLPGNSVTYEEIYNYFSTL